MTSVAHPSSCGFACSPLPDSEKVHAGHQRKQHRPPSLNYSHAGMLGTSRSNTDPRDLARSYNVGSCLRMHHSSPYDALYSIKKHLTVQPVFATEGDTLMVKGGQSLSSEIRVCTCGTGAICADGAHHVRQLFPRQPRSHRGATLLTPIRNAGPPPPDQRAQHAKHAQHAHAWDRDA